MKSELSDYLNRKYSKLYMQDGEKTAFSIGDGWFKIINALSANITHHISYKQKHARECLYLLELVKNNDVKNYPAWLSKELEENPNYDIKTRHGFSEEIPAFPKVDQIKEKFGTLRYYASGADDAISAMISLTESMSGFTCEVCGNLGKSNSTGWVRVLCDEHNENENVKRVLKVGDSIGMIKFDNDTISVSITEMLADDLYMAATLDSAMSNNHYSDTIMSKQSFKVKKIETELITYYKEVE